MIRTFRATSAAVLAAAMFAAAGPAVAASIVVTPWVAPNGFGSPSYAGAVLNANTALHGGQTSAGDPNSPTYFEADSNVTRDEVIVTGFSSWRGTADPAAPYSAELGNRMLFGLTIDGEGSKFSISQLSFVGDSNDAANALDFGFAAGAFNYSNDYWGVLVGDDGDLFTADDVFVKAGANTQLVDGLVGRGSGNSFAAYCAGCTTTAERQAAIDLVANYPGYPTTFTGTYTLGNLGSGSGTFNISPAVPEPATWAMMIAGFGMVGASMRRRRPARLATA